MVALFRRVPRSSLRWLALLLLLPAGCGKGTGTVTGKLTYKDKTVVIGTVSLHSKETSQPLNSQMDASSPCVS